MWVKQNKMKGTFKKIAVNFTNIGPEFVSTDYGKQRKTSVGTDRYPYLRHPVRRKTVNL